MQAFHSIYFLFTNPSSSFSNFFFLYSGIQFSQIPRQFFPHSTRRALDLAGGEGENEEHSEGDGKTENESHKRVEIKDEERRESED